MISSNQSWPLKCMDSRTTDIPSIQHYFHRTHPIQEAKTSSIQYKTPTTKHSIPIINTFKHSNNVNAYLRSSTPSRRDCLPLCMTSCFSNKVLPLCMTSCFSNKVFRTFFVRSTLSGKIVFIICSVTLFRQIIPRSSIHSYIRKWFMRHFVLRDNIPIHTLHYIDSFLDWHLSVLKKLLNSLVYNAQIVLHSTIKPTHCGNLSFTCSSDG